MKQIFTIVVLAFLMNAFVKADGLATFVLDNFESGAVSFTTEVHVNPAASMDIAVVNNPVKAGINTSNKVWEWARFDVTPDTNQPWSGFWSVLATAIPNGYHRIEIKYLRTNSTSQLKIKCEGAVTKEIAAVTPATKVNEWETMVFDIYTAGIKNINVFGFFPDFCDPINPAAKVYIDDITIIYDPSVVPPPAPTLLTLFDNSADNRFHDQSWVNPTAPSTVNAVLWSDPTQPGDKLPAVTTPVKAGANALKLQWKSATGGDWMALVASVGWKSFDLTTMTHFKFWMNSPVTIAKTAMPKIHFEAHSGNPNSTGKVDLGNYLTDDLAANTWTEIAIPLADIWATNALFTAKNVIKGVFFTQNAIDNVEHTMYLDEFTFENVTSLFTNSASDRFHDQSWSFKNAPSTLTQVHWDAASTEPGDKLPCVTTPVKSAPNAIKLQWKSVTGGDWAAIVAGLAWAVYDLKDMTHIKLWVNSPANLAKSALPKVNFESHSGNPNATGKIELGNYTNDLIANKWTQITIPLADFWAAKPEFIAKDVVKGIFFSQNATDNVEHILYIDEISFAKNIATGLFTPKVENHVSAYYNNGEIYIENNYSGNIQVVDLAGKVVGLKLANNGKVSLNLNKGIYFITTAVGNSKLMVY